jgi:thiamine-phosphate pyrophosphorylase
VKPDAVRATLEDIEQGRMLVESSRVRPRAAVVAIGGITADNAGPVVHAGADSIALISGLFESDDIRATAARCAALFA